MGTCNTTLVSITGKPIEEAALRKFEASLIGEVIRPTSERYEHERRLWIGFIDPRRPGLVVRCVAPADVIRCVDFCRHNELPIAVRSTGHSNAGDSLCDGGVVIDVSGLKTIRIDPSACRAQAGAGLTVGELDRATHPFDLATVLGECSSVGIAGLSLGGGLGRLMGKHGAACDNLISAELVTADGRLFRASADENEDLFWAIRGGGGNFGIATSLEYQLHPAGQVLSGVLRYPIAAAREVLSFLHEFMMNVPDEFDVAIDIGDTGTMTYAPGIMEPIVNLSVTYCGDLKKGEAALKPLRSFRRPLADTIRAMSYLEMQSQADLRPMVEFGSGGGLMALEAGFIEQLDADTLETLLALIAKAPSRFWFSAEHYLHGAICAPQSSEMAFGLRRRGYTFRVLTAWREASQTDASIAWVNNATAALEHFSGGAAYLNYLSSSTGEAGVRAAYGSNYERLAAIKRKFDPDNFFSSNRNIKPETRVGKDDLLLGDARN